MRARKSNKLSPLSSQLSAISLCALGALCVLAIGLGGCAGQKAVDSTLAVNYLTRPEGQTAPLVIPPVAGLPEPWRDRALVLGTYRDKDYDVQLYYADGKPFATIKTSRSAVTDAILGKIAGIDTDKFAEASQERAWITAEREAWMSMILPIIQQQLAASSAATTQPTTTKFVDELKAALLEALKAQAGK